MSRCTICDMGRLAKTDPEGAVALTLFLGCAGKELDGFKKLMCQAHRDAWALLLLRGGYRLDHDGEVTP